MSNEKKHHYRNVFKSDHLSSADLEDLIEQGSNLCFTIKQVKQEFGAKVAGKKGDFNIAYFVEPIKPLVLNATNSKIIRSFAGNNSFVENWVNIPIELYVDENVRAVTGGITQGIRIRPIQPRIKVKQDFVLEMFDRAKTAGATIEKIKAMYNVTAEIEKQYNDYVTT